MIRCHICGREASHIAICSDRLNHADLLCPTCYAAYWRGQSNPHAHVVHIASLKEFLRQDDDEEEPINKASEEK